jgi:drug/metabolite transporter (DMT)-like permease
MAICSSDALGFRMALCIAVMKFIIRHRHEPPMLPAAYISALLRPLLGGPFASPPEIGTINLLKLLLFGTTQFGLGRILLTIGVQLVAAAENALISALEAPIAFTCIRVGFAEVATITNFVGASS